MVIWELLHPSMELASLGYLPGMLNDSDPRPACKQFDTGYRNGGGWQPFQGHRLRGDNALCYPGDPPMYPLAQAWLRDELILYYPHDWVAIVQRDRSFEVCRMD